MVRTLALGFGVATALAVAAGMTPTGQAMLGLRRPAEKATTVTVIQDKPAAIPAPALSAAPAQPSSSAPQSRPVPPAGQSVPQQGGQGAPGGLAGVANILLNLPQVLDQTHVGPAHGSDSWSESRPADSQPDSQEPSKILRKKHHEPEKQRKDAGDGNN